jgi:1-acyl-sn-glycerol-3-phosphate acyltransferase
MIFAARNLQSILRRFTRIARAISHALLLIALLLAATIDGRIRHAFGLLRTGPEGAIWIHFWCRRIVNMLGIEYTIDGELPGRLAESRSGFEAVVCNHLSYIDILLMSASRPFIGVAKKEVRSWPLLGWLIAQAGTVFVQRGAAPSTYPAVNAAMAYAFRSGLPVLFFPEGTTTDGSEVLPFRRGLFHSVLHDHVQVRVAALRYELPSDELEANVANDVCWWGDALLVTHLVRLMALRGLRASVRFGEVVDGQDRFALSQSAHDAVSTLYDELTLPSIVERVIAPHRTCGLTRDPI